MRIEACFDSHVHWVATGEFAGRLRLEALASAHDVANLKTENAHARGDWLLGFGWDERSWKDKPTRQILDARFPGRPVAFARADGHGLWVNTEALRRAGLLNGFADERNGRVERDATGVPTGVLIDRATERIEKLIPPLEPLALRHHLLQATKIFNDAGYTHIRDVTMDEARWNEALHLDASGLLTLAVECFFGLRGLDRLEKTIDLCVRARAAQSANLRVKGLKIFLDGALGSEDVWLSRPYRADANHGLILWREDEIKEILTRAWASELEIAVHAIGAGASAALANVLTALKGEGKAGKTHIEHGELLRPETIAKLRLLDVEFHLQPSHWFGEHQGLLEKVGSLEQFAFPWRKLQEAEIPFDFGSDSPIAMPSLKRCVEALRLSQAAGVPRLLGDPKSCMGHRDHGWAPNSFTLFENEEPKQVVFRGEHLN